MSLSNPEFYNFLPYLRKGLASKISTQDALGPDTGVSSLRPELDFNVDLTGAPNFTKTIKLLGPGDISSVSQDVILRQAPLPSEEAFLPNMMPFIDFFDEDFPWRYTPLSPNIPKTNGQEDALERKLRPWLALVVLTNGTDADLDEFEYLENQTVPNRGIRILKAHSEVFPNESQTWAWAHVQALGGNMEGLDSNQFSQAVNDEIKNILKEEPSRVVSRIICPRRLKAGLEYHAFLIPSFELGRRAGLGIDIGTDVNIQEPSWAVDGSKSAITNYPIYHSWTFKTDSSGDFESLVRKINPSLPDPDVGKIPLNILQPNHPNLDGEANDPYVLMGGALRQAGETDTLFKDSGNDSFVDALRELVNLGDNLTQNTTTGLVDPVISLPLYGRWHAAQSTVAKNQFWLSELNLDPKFRASAGVGVKAFKENQESYLEMAWKQVGEVNEANRRLAFTQVAHAAAEIGFQKNFESLPNQSVISMTVNNHTVIRDSANATTLKKTISGSKLSARMNDSAFVNLASAQSRIMRNSNITALEKFNIADAVANGSLLPIGPNVFPALRANVAAALAASDKLPLSYSGAANLSNFTLVKPSSSYTSGWSSDGADSSQATFVKTHVAQAYQQAQTITASYPVEVSAPSVSLSTLRDDVLSELDPTHTFSIKIRNWLRVEGSQLPPTLNIKWLAKPMAAPTIDYPAFNILREYSPDMVIPNFHKVPPNTFTLLETNNKFIESFLVGMNYEMGRELLWGDYPTDQRGTYFNRFWDSNAPIPAPASLVPSAERDEVIQENRNINPIHTWGPNSSLGTHNNDLASVEANLVVVLRADLLKKYPNLLIYAVPAEAWREEPAGSQTYIRNPDWSGVKKFPIFYGKMPPDALLVGFDLTASEAKGSGLPSDPAANPGWYFVMEERVGDIRFGLDELDDPANFQHDLVDSWHNLTWANMGADTGVYDPAGVNYIDISSVNTSSKEYEDIPWSKSASNMAWIFYQPAVRVSIHANDLIQ
jgi:hypothetical protein